MVHICVQELVTLQGILQLQQLLLVLSMFLRNPNIFVIQSCHRFYFLYQSIQLLLVSCLVCPQCYFMLLLYDHLSVLCPVQQLILLFYLRFVEGFHFGYFPLEFSILLKR